MNSKGTGHTVYLIGRGSEVCICIDDTSISRIHAEVVVTTNGALLLTDRASSGGTYVARDGNWLRITQDFVKPSDSILLGRYKTTVEKILQQVDSNTGKQNVEAGQEAKEQDALPSGPVRRNPETGEVIRDE